MKCVFLRIRKEGKKKWDIEAKLQCDKKDIVLPDGIMPIIDYFRVYVNGKYYGKTKTTSISLRKRKIE